MPPSLQPQRRPWREAPPLRLLRRDSRPQSRFRLDSQVTLASGTAPAATTLVPAVVSAEAVVAVAVAAEDAVVSVVSAAAEATAEAAAPG